MQEFTFCGVLFDFVRRSKTVAVCFFLLKMEIFFINIHHKTIHVYEIIISFPRILSLVSEKITSVCLAYIQSCFFSDFS